MSELPAPLVPPEVDLQDFPFMPLHVARLRDSDFNVKVSDAEFRCAVLLWSAAWHQLPAGSLPDDDAILANLAGLGRNQRIWKKIRAGALYGFTKCSDGRLYHETITEQVNEAWESKLRQRHRTFCAAIRKHNSRHDDDVRDTPDFDTWLSQGQPTSVTRDITHKSHVTPPEKGCDIASKGQGQGQGQGQYILEPKGSCASRDARQLDFSEQDAEEVEQEPAFEPPPKLEPEHVTEIWNETAERLWNGRKIRDLTPARRTLLKSRIAQYSLDDFKTVFDRIENSAFLREWPGMSFDWMLKRANFQKIIEGNYDR